MHKHSDSTALNKASGFRYTERRHYYNVGALCKLIGLVFLVSVFLVTSECFSLEVPVLAKLREMMDKTMKIRYCSKLECPYNIIIKVVQSNSVIQDV